MRKIEEILQNLPENIKKPIFEAFVAFRDDIILKEIIEVKQEINRVWKAIDELASTQKRTEQILQRLAEEHEKLKEEVRKLAEAQARTEQQVQKLAEELEKLREEVRKLVEAQVGTERRLQKLINEHEKTRENLAGLSHTVGHLLEDRAIKSLPKILKKYGIEVVGELSRDYIRVGVEYIEVNIYGKAIKDGKEYILLGEVKTRVSIKAIDEFIEKCDVISKEAIKVFISYIFPPHIKEYAKEKQIILIPSYQLEL